MIVVFFSRVTTAPLVDTMNSLEIILFIQSLLFRKLNTGKILNCRNYKKKNLKIVIFQKILQNIMIYKYLYNMNFIIQHFSYFI